MDPDTAKLLASDGIMGHRRGVMRLEIIGDSVVQAGAMILNTTIQAAASAAASNLVRSADGNQMAGLRAANGAEPYHTATPGKTT